MSSTRPSAPAERDNPSVDEMTPVSTSKAASAHDNEQPEPVKPAASPEASIVSQPEASGNDLEASTTAARAEESMAAELEKESRGEAREPLSPDTPRGGTDQPNVLQSPQMVLGLFPTADALMSAIGRIRHKNLGKLEAYTPYPIHGIDDALGLRRSPLGAMVMVMGIIGASTAVGFQLWVSAVDYPIVTGGKPPWSWEAFVPIMFEVTVLFATFTAGLGMLFLLNKLPFFGHPVLGSRSMREITRDRFALAIESHEEGDAPIDVKAAESTLSELGALSVEVVPRPPREPIFTSSFILRSLTGILVACGVAGFSMYWAVKLFPILPPMSHMLDQPRLGPQEPSKFWKDGHGMRMPAPGSVARGHLPLGKVSQDEATNLANPLPRSLQTLKLGKQKFMERCSVCHGALADGNGSLTAAYGAKPANLQSEQFRKYTDGQIYWVVTNGKSAMPSHAADLNEDQRWAVVHYVRALQRAQNAKDEDLDLSAGPQP